MKKIKYLLQRTQKEKAKEASQHKSHYLKTFKSEAMKTLQDFQQDRMNKTQLNITLRNTYSSQSQYRSRSEYKSNMPKTTTSQIQKTSQTSTQKNQQKKQFLTGQNTSINIRKLLRLKTEAEQQQPQKLKNPFYKIQKARLMQEKKKLSCVVEKSSIIDEENNENPFNNTIYIARQQNQPQFYRHNKQPQNEPNDNKNDQSFLISRDKKQWYFAAKKLRSRTCHNQLLLQKTKYMKTTNKTKHTDQHSPKNNSSQPSSVHVMDTLSSSKKLKTQEQQPLKTEQSQRQSSLRQCHSYSRSMNKQKSRRMSGLSTFTPEEVSELRVPLKKTSSILVLDHGSQQQPTIKEEGSRQSSPFRIREKSLTIKYNEIKQYFEKKYANKQENERKLSGERYEQRGTFNRQTGSNFHSDEYQVLLGRKFSDCGDLN